MLEGIVRRSLKKAMGGFTWTFKGHLEGISDDARELIYLGGQVILVSINLAPYKTPIGHPIRQHKMLIGHLLLCTPGTGICYTNPIQVSHSSPTP